MTQGSPQSVFESWNALDADAASREVLPCCGSQAWARELAALRPFADQQEIYEASDRVWRGLGKRDWQEAFDSHPRIGQAMRAQRRLSRWPGRRRSSRLR